MASAYSFSEEKTATTNRTYLYGGDKEWREADWTPVNDTVRGGKSTSFLKPVNNRTSAIFSGFLDVKTLGGAGFASQRTDLDEKRDLTQSDGVELNLGKSDGKRYNLILKDEILPKRLDGRERSSVNWEYAFVLPAEDRENYVLTIRWDDFEPTFRGKPLEDFDRKLDVGRIRRISIMMRSYFGSQEGNYELEIKSIAVLKEIPTEKDLLGHSDSLTATSPSKSQQKRNPIARILHHCGLACFVCH